VIATSDVRYGDPLVNRGKTLTVLYPNREDREREADCIRDQLHLHVWPDVVGINVHPHGDTLSLGFWGYDSPVPSGVRIKPGWLYEWRVRRAIERLDVAIRRLKDRHASIAATAARLEATR